MNEPYPRLFETLLIYVTSPGPRAPENEGVRPTREPAVQHRHSILIAAVVLVALVLLFAARTASGADAERGRALYDLRCGSCHSESVHGRQKRVATNFEDVRRWVDRWNGSLGLRWDGEEIDDVAVYLNATYYRYACPPNICKVVSMAPAPNPRLHGVSSQPFTSR